MVGGKGQQRCLIKAKIKMRAYATKVHYKDEKRPPRWGLLNEWILLYLRVTLHAHYNNNIIIYIGPIYIIYYNSF